MFICLNSGGKDLRKLYRLKQDLRNYSFFIYIHTGT